MFSFSRLLSSAVVFLAAAVMFACGPSYAQTDWDGSGGNWNNLGGDGGTGGDASQYQDGFVLPDSQAGDAGTVYQFDGAVATDACPPSMSTPCPTPVPPGCVANEVCGNGLDDNCNGTADEAPCNCAPGSVQQCFIGPPGRVDVGACVMGTQTCQGTQEFGQWGPCEGGIWPSAEICDDLDNDCNGCTDDGLCCDPPISCPDPTSIPAGQPFTTYQLDGTQWYSGVAQSWQWEVTGGPCDELFIAQGHSPSFTLNGGNTATPTIDFTLSGDYTVTMTVVTTSGTYTCTFIIHVVGPGFRVELCWESTGLFGRDLDLHLLREDLGASWCDNSNANQEDDCYYWNCKAGESDASRPNWGYTSSPIGECSGGPEGGTWQSLHNHCDNPRLDIDNIMTAGIPENINVDNPNDGDIFRVMVHYYSGTGAEHPLVNIYCDGYRVATYGEAPNTVPGYNSSGSGCQGDTWRVADVTMSVIGGITTCQVDALHPAGQVTGFDVRTNDTSY